MTEYYNPTTKILKSESEIRTEFHETSFPSVITSENLKTCGYFSVNSTSKPTASDLTKVIVRDGVSEKDGVYSESWVEKDRFSGTDKTALDTAYQKEQDDAKAVLMRSQRNQLLAETDYYALSDVTMTEEMKSYREKLRSLPEDANFPNCDFPTKP